MIKRLSIKVTLKSLLLLASMENRQNQMDDYKIDDVLYGRIVIPFHSFSSKSRNSKVFTHSDFKVALSFALICSIAATALKFINKEERKETRILSLNVKKNYQLVLSLEYNSKIAVGSLFFFTPLIIVRI